MMRGQDLNKPDFFVVDCPSCGSKRAVFDDDNLDALDCPSCKALFAVNKEVQGAKARLISPGESPDSGGNEQALPSGKKARIALAIMIIAAILGLILYGLVKNPF
jgi:hypothetical protein